MRAQKFMGVAALACAAGLAFLALVYQPPWWTRLIVFVPLWLAGAGLLKPGAQQRWTITAGAITALLALLP